MTRLCNIEHETYIAGFAEPRSLDSNGRGSVPSSVQRPASASAWYYRTVPSPWHSFCMSTVHEFRGRGRGAGRAGGFGQVPRLRT